MGRGKRIAKGIGCGLIGLVGVALVGAGGVVAWVATDGGERFVEGQLTKVLDNSFAEGGVSFGSLDLSWRDGLTLTDVAVEGPSGATVVTVPRIHADLRPRDLLAKRIRVSRLTVHRPDVAIGRRSDGTLDLPVAAPSNQPSDPDAPYLPLGLSLSIDDVVVEGGSLALPDDDVDVDHLSVVGGLELHDRDLRLPRVALSGHLAAPDLGTLSTAGELSLLDTDLHADLALWLPGAAARVGGSVDDLLGEELVLDDVRLTATARRDTIERAASLGSEEPVELPDGLRAVQLEADAQGPLRGLTAHVDARLLDRLQLEPSSDPTVSVDLAAALPDDTHALNASADVRVPSLAPLAALGAPDDLEGSARATLAVFEDDEGAVQVDGLLRSDGVTVAAARIASLSVPTHVRVPANGPIEVSGALSTGTVVFDPLVADRVAADVQLTLPTDGGGPVGRIDLAVPYLRGDISEGRAARVSVNGDVVMDGEQAAAELTVRDHDDEDLRLDLDGSYAFAEQTATIRELVLVLAPDQELSNPEPWRATLADGGAVDVRASLTGPPGGFWLEAERLGAERQTGSLRLEDLDLAVFRDLGHRFVELPPINGIIDGSATVDHGDDVPPALTADLTVDGLRVTPDVGAVDVQLEGRIAEEVLHAEIRASEDRSSDVWATVTADLPLQPVDLWLQCEEEGRLTVSVPERSYADIRDLVDPTPEAPVDELTVALDATFDGDLCDPDTHATARATGTYEERPLRLVVDVDESEEQTLDLRAGLDLDGATRLLVMGTAHHASLRSVLEGEAEPTEVLEEWDAVVKALGVPADLLLAGSQGRAYGRIGAEGEALRLSSAHAGLQLDGFEVDGKPISGALHAETDDDLVVTGELLADMPDTDDIEATARFELGQALYGADPLAAAVQVDFGHAELPLATVASLSGDALTQGAGVLVLDGSVGGTLDALEGDLSLNTTDARITVAATGVRYEDIELDAVLDGQVLRLDTLSLGSRPRYGRYALEKQEVDLRGSGEVRLGDDFSVDSDLEFDLDRFWVIANGTGLLEVEADLTVAGTYPDITIGGRLGVDEARLDLERYMFLRAADIRVDDDIAFVDGRKPRLLQPPEEEDDGLSVADLVDIETTVDLNRSVNVTAIAPLAANAGALGKAADIKADARADGQLEIDKDDEEIAIDGTVSTEGEVDLFNASFDIEQGNIAFTGTDYASPQIDVALERSGGDYGDVRARVTGNPKDLSIAELTSDEYSDQADVMALLLFGRPLTELDEGESQGGSQVVQSALLSVVGSQVEEALGTSVVDSVRYDPGDGLALGWSIGTDAFLTVALNPTAEDDENTTVARVNWLIGRNAEAEVATGDAGNSEAWLLLETRF